MRRQTGGSFAACTGVIALVAVLAAATGAQEPLTMNVMTFDGKDGYVELPQNLFDHLTEGTIETWVKWEKFNKWSRVFDFGRENNAFVVQTENNKKSVNYRIWEGKRRDHKIQAKNKLRQGVWHHIAAVFGRSGMAFYLDGELIGRNAYEGGLSTAAGGNNYIGKSNWPKDKLFRGQMAEFRVWERRLSPDEIGVVKDRVLRGDEDGLVGYWHLGDASEGEAPSAIAGGFPGRLVGNIGLKTIPPITPFLVPGQLEIAAEAAYSAADAAFTEAAYEQAVTKFDDVIHLVRDYKDAAERRVESQNQWDLAEADAAYAEGVRFQAGGDAAQAYWAYDRAILKVPNFQDAAAKREEALRTATYDVGLSVFLSSKVRERLTPQEEESGSRWSRFGSSLEKVSRKSQIGGAAFSDAEDILYSRMERVLDDRRAPYVRLRRRNEMRRLIEQGGATADFAHYEQVIEAARTAGIPVVVFAEITEAYTKLKTDPINVIAWTTKKVDYTDEDGKEKEKDVEVRSYPLKRFKIRTEMGCTLSYRIVSTATGMTIDEGEVDAADADEVDFINWNKRDGVDPRHLRKKSGTGFRPLSSDVRSAIDARSNIKSDAEMLRSGAEHMADEFSEALLKTLTYYSPGPK